MQESPPPPPPSIRKVPVSARKKREERREEASREIEAADSPRSLSPEPQRLGRGQRATRGRGSWRRRGVTSPSDAHLPDASGDGAWTS